MKKRRINEKIFEFYTKYDANMFDYINTKSTSEDYYKLHEGFHNNVIVAGGNLFKCTNCQQIKENVCSTKICRFSYTPFVWLCADCLYNS